MWLVLLSVNSQRELIFYPRFIFSPSYACIEHCCSTVSLNYEYTGCMPVQTKGKIQYSTMYNVQNVHTIFLQRVRTWTSTREKALRQQNNRWKFMQLFLNWKELTKYLHISNNKAITHLIIITHSSDWRWHLPEKCQPLNSTWPTDRSTNRTVTWWMCKINE